MQYPTAFLLIFNYFLKQFNRFDYLILSTILDVWSKICNNFEITSVLMIEVMLDKYFFKWELCGMDANGDAYPCWLLPNSVQLEGKKNASKTPLKTGQ